MNSPGVRQQAIPRPNAGGTEAGGAAARPLLSVRHLRVRLRPKSVLPWKRSRWFEAVNDLHLDLRSGETLAITGESGSGKSTLARALAGLEANTSGSLRIDGAELVGLNRKQSRPLRRDVQLVPENPRPDFGKKKTVAQVLEEPLRELCPDIDGAERTRRVAAALQRVGLVAAMTGQRASTLEPEAARRLSIARAMIPGPKILICDEPLKGLDGPAQGAIASLLGELKSEYKIALISVSVDLEAIQRLHGRVIVMYLGRVMEQAPGDLLFSSPRHPYTRALLARVAAESGNTAPTDPDANLIAPLSGELPDPLAPPMGCVFHTRCPLMESTCIRSAPNLRRVGREHYAACHFVGEA